MIQATIKRGKGTDGGKVVPPSDDPSSDLLVLVPAVFLERRLEHRVLPWSSIFLLRGLKPLKLLAVREDLARGTGSTSHMSNLFAFPRVQTTTPLIFTLQNLPQHGIIRKRILPDSLSSTRPALSSVAALPLRPPRPRPSTRPWPPRPRPRDSCSCCNAGTSSLWSARVLLLGRTPSIFPRLFPQL